MRLRVRDLSFDERIVQIKGKGERRREVRSAARKAPVRFPPAHRDLDDAVQLGDGCILFDEEAPPDHWADLEEAYLELADVLVGGVGLGRHGL